jgi:magnesium chelatase subunit D
MSEAALRWADALDAARLVAAAGSSGLGGVQLRARPGPVRDLWLETLMSALPAGVPLRRLPPGVEAERLTGGLDLAATLALGRPVMSEGLLAEAAGGVLVLPMAERLEPEMAGRLAQALDAATPAHPCPMLVALDEGDADAGLAPILGARLALVIDLDGLRVQDRDAGMHTAPAAGDVVSAEQACDALCRAAWQFGIGSARVPVLAYRAACARATLARRPLAAGDLEWAARLVLAPRALSLPQPAGESPGQEPPPPPRSAEQNSREQDSGEQDSGEQDSAEQEPVEQDSGAQEPVQQQKPPGQSLEDLLIEAAAAVLPPELAALQGGQALPGRSAPGARGAGQVRGSPRRGRPVGVRAGLPRGGLRLALVETLKAAAPWQRVRRQASLRPETFQVRKADLRLRRFKRPAQSVSIFLVDASGSAAIARLAEAKGAVELLLARAYVRRDEVALIAFRGQAAELLLPPTRSLARARRALADLPGGGGTPLAHALELGAALALGCRARGRTPTILLLTDGRANVARASGLDPLADAEAAAQAIAAAGIASVLVDTAPRPRPEGPRLARAMHGCHLALPRVEAARLVEAVERAA